jgi:hypothetical protein
MKIHKNGNTCDNLEHFLDEYEFQFNNRKKKNRFILFYKFIKKTVTVPPVKREELLKNSRLRKTSKK